MTERRFFEEIIVKKNRKKLNLSRAPLPRQTGGAHIADKGGKHSRNREKEKSRREIKAEFE